jgi:chemotaxis methyl-accepting protein methylase
MEGLIDALTIKVSHFFRNPFVFEALKKFVLPELIESRHGEGLRVWSAGCARGEEAYSMAILLNEIMREELLFTYLFILATDIDVNALEDGQKAVYTDEALSEIKKGYFDRYFIAEGDSYRVKDEIRSMVTFASHDVTTCKPPKEGIFSSYHIILCRNVLIYLDRHTQAKVLKSLSEFLLNKGYLILGEAEIMPQQLSGDFHEVVPNTKIFRKGL